MSISHELHPPDPAAILAADFNPTPRLAEQILSDIHAADSTLVAIARRANTTLESLALWLTRPEIAARIQAVHTARCICIQTKLAKYSDSMMDACQSILECYHNSASHLTFQDNDLRGHAILARKSSNALLAGRILLHLGKHFNPNPPRRRDRTQAAPTPPPTRDPNPPGPRSELPTSPFPLPTSAPLPRLTDPTLLNFPQPSFTIPLPLHPAPTSPTHDNAHPQPAPNREPAPVTERPGANEPTKPASTPPPLPTSDIPHPKSEIPHPKSNIPPHPSHPRSSVANSNPGPRCTSACTTCHCPTSDISHLKSDIPHRAREPTAAHAG